MKISYNWLSEYLPVKQDPHQLSGILTSVGLEVENLEKYEEIRGNMEGLVIGEVLEVYPHPGADRLQITRVDTGAAEPLQIVCGAPNVAKGQKVVVAPVGTTIYPVNGDPVKMKAARIRGEDSQGMICAEDEIGLGEGHEGILVLREDVQAGLPAKAYFHPLEDWVYEIGLTPNRMDAMSHLGVARDVCAWLSNTEGKSLQIRTPSVADFKIDNHDSVFTIEVENTVACPRYAGLSVTQIKVGPSPAWLKQKLQAIGVRSINNIVDITNFVMHETGQPLHAFDGDKIAGEKIIVKNLPAGTPFITLDGIERKLDAEDLMICDAREAICLAGVFGGMHSGVTDQTTRIFLESACFNATGIRRSSFRHDLRTDAAMRFEKGVDISGVPYALKRAASLMKALCGARVSSPITDVYPAPRERTGVSFSYDYLARLSGRTYAAGKVKTILESLGFTILREAEKALEVAVPYSKPDIALPADLAEEVMRIDGYDRVAAATHVNMVPVLMKKPDTEALREKVSGYLTSNGFYEIFTNSITSSHYYDKSQPLIRLLNNLSSELDVMRPSLLETGLEAVAHNLNRKQPDVLFFELGKTYRPDGKNYDEKEYLALYLSGDQTPESWLRRPVPVDSYFLKGHLQNIFSLLGLPAPRLVPGDDTRMNRAQKLLLGENDAGKFGQVSGEMRQRFGIRQPVWYAQLDWALLTRQSGKMAVSYRDIPRLPSMRRDLALILDKKIPFEAVEKTARSVKANTLQAINLFDVFQGEKLGAHKKSYAVSFLFRHPEKTLTDQEIDKVMRKLTVAFEQELGAEIRK
jgi:phenylalanyl-tRNA synthetase beta chain